MDRTTVTSAFLGSVDLPPTAHVRVDERGHLHVRMETDNVFDVIFENHATLRPRAVLCGGRIPKDAAGELLEAAKWALRGLEKLAADEAVRRGTTQDMCDYTFAKALRNAISKVEEGG